MAWFARDYTGRRLTESERAFLAALVDLLSEVRPAQIDESEIALTAERDACLIVLMPHRALGGISIVVWLWASEAAVSVAQVGGLDISHDSLDLGVWIARTEFDPSRPNFAPLLACIRDQLFAPLTVRSNEANQATVWVRDERQALRRVGDLGTSVGWLQRIVHRRPFSEIQIRFVDSDPPPVVEPSNVEKWFTTSRGT
jgi:hypothetical protein